MYVRISTQEVLTYSQVRAFAEGPPRVPFLKGGPSDEWLAKLGIARVIQIEAPTVQANEVAYLEGVEEVSGEWRTKWSIRQKSPSEVDEWEAEKAAILTEYRKTIEEGGFEFQGIFIPTDDKTERRIIGARVKAEADPNYTITDWTTDGGQTTVTLTAAIIIAISNAFDAHVQKSFSAQVAVRAVLENLNSRAEIEAAFDAAMTGA